MLPRVTSVGHQFDFVFNDVLKNVLFQSVFHYYLFQRTFQGDRHGHVSLVRQAVVSSVHSQAEVITAHCLVAAGAPSIVVVPDTVANRQSNKRKESTKSARRASGKSALQVEMHQSFCKKIKAN